MATKNYVDHSLPAVDAAWLNDVDAVTYEKVQNVTTVSPFMATVLDDTTATDARQTLGAAASGANTDITSLGGVFVGRGGGSLISNARYGQYALNSNTSGAANTALGDIAAISNTSGGYNVAVGYEALRDNTTNYSNTAVGAQALMKFQGEGNTAVGTGAMGGYAGTGGHNVAIGHSAMTNAQSTAGGNISIGSFNAAGSYLPCLNITTQSNQISMGHTSIANAYVQVGWTTVSDARDKMNFAHVPHGLDFVNALRPVAYQFKETRDSEVASGPVRYGFKAQEILALEGDSPVIVNNEDDEKLRLTETYLIPVLVKAIQELTARVALLEARQ